MANPFLDPGSPEAPRQNPFLAPVAPPRANPFIDPASPAAVAAATDKFQGERPFWQRAAEGFKKGAIGLEAGAAGTVGASLATQSTGMLQALDSIDKGLPVDEATKSFQFQPAELEAIRGYAESPTPARGAIRNTLLKQYGQAAEPVVGLNQRADAIPSAPSVAGIGENIARGDYLSAAKIFAQSPLETMMSFGTESLPSTLPAIVASVVAGPEAGAAVMGGTASAQDYGQSIVSFLESKGVDVKSPQALAKAFADPGLMGQAKEFATARQPAQFGGNAAAALTGGLSLVPERMVSGPVAREATNLLVAQPLTQAALGGGTEAASQLQSTGTVSDPAAVGLNALGEFAGAPLEAAGFGAHRIAGLLSPDRGAPLAESEVRRILGEGRSNEAPVPPATTPPPPPAGPTTPDASVSEAGKVGGENKSGEKPGIVPGDNSERLTAAALKVGDKIYSGPTHADAYEKALADGVDEATISKLDQNGFVTSTGRYVDRAEARKIAQASGQKKRVVNGSVTSQGTLSPSAEEIAKATTPELRAELYKSYGLDPKTGQTAEAPVSPPTPQQVAEQTQNSPPINMIPSGQPRTLYRQKTIDGKGNKGVFGEGHYYTFDADPSTADFEARRGSGLKPMTVSNDGQWNALAQKLGFNPDVTSMTPQERLAAGVKIRAYVQSRGFDSLHVNPEGKGRTDFNEHGESVRLLRKNFSKPVVVAYDNAQEGEHTLIPKGSQSDTNSTGSPFFNLGSFTGDLSNHVRNVDEASLKPNTVTVINEPVEQAAQVNKIQQFIEEFSRKFLRGAKVVLDFDSGGFMAKNAVDKKFLGQFFGTADGTVVLWMNPEALFSDPFLSVQVMAHEFGHAVAWWNWYNTDAATQQSINEAYQEYLVRSAKMPAEEAIAETQSAWALSSLASDSDVNARVLNGEMIDKHVERLKRWFDFDEWMAEQFVRWATTDAKPLTIVDKYFKGISEKIKQVFRFFGIDASKSAATPAMTAWFQSLMEKHEAGIPSSTPYAVLHSQLKGMQQIREELGEDWGIDGPTPSPATAGMRRLFRSAGVPVQVAAQVDKYNWWIGKMWGLLQIAAKNPHIQGLANFVEAIRGFHISKMELVSRADGRLREWRKLGKSMATSLSNFMFDVDSMTYLQPNENARWPSNAELIFLAQRHGLNQEALQLYLKIKDDFSHVLDKMQAAWLRDAQASITDPAQLWKAIQNISAEMGNLRAKPYFPHERFGEWTLTSRDATGRTVFFQQFSNRRTAVQAAEQYARANPGESVSTGRMPREVAQFRGLPPTLMRSLASRLNLTANQQRQLDDLILDLSPANSAAKRFKKRTGTAGYSLDGMRAYAHYFSTMSGWLARLEYSGPMQEAIKAVQGSVRAMTGVYAADAVHRRLGIAEWMQRSFDYLHDGKSEWQGLRSFAFLWYLGYNVSSAMINLTQVPMVALPYLSSRFGDLSAMNELRKAYSNVRGNYLMRQGGHTPDMQAALTEATKQGFIDESMASELASAASGGTLVSMLPGTAIQRGLMRFANIGSVPFQLMEKLNRRVVFQAAFRLAQAKPFNPEVLKIAAASPEQLAALRAQGWTEVNAKAFLAARDAIEKSQFEYAKWARPEFMRGKKAVLFTFWMFKQNMLWFLGHDKGAGRAWIMMLAAAGVMGLPGADALNDLVKFLARHVGGRYFDPQLELRKLLVNQLHMDPDLVMHGLGYHTLGMTAVGDALGIPVPDVDLSSRLGMQQLVPGLQPMLAINRDSWDERFGKSAQQVLGAGINVPLGILKAVTTSNPDSFKQIERGLPTAFKNLAKAYRWLHDGAETTRSGAEVESFDVLDSRSRIEVAAQALGFTPSVLAAKRELAAEQFEAGQYWALRRTELFEQFAFARMSGDKEAMTAAKEAIQSFNKTAPNGKLKISGEDLKSNLKARLRANAKTEAGVAPTQGMTPVYRGIQPLYPGASAPRQ